jgi:phospholipid/cholesterol/gamma-HCH transport system substrate-binding protein
VRATLAGTDKLLRALNGGRADIELLLTSLGSASGQLAAHEDDIEAALKMSGPVVRVLQRNAGNLVSTLTRITQLTGRVDGLVRATREPIADMTRELGPIIAQLLSSKEKVKSMLSDASRLAFLLDRAVPTDFLNLQLVLRAAGIRVGARQAAVSPRDESQPPGLDGTRNP